MPADLVDEVTHVCVLNACSHSGLVDQAHIIFRGIKNATEMAYTTMVAPVSWSWWMNKEQRLSRSVDCFSRAARFEEAQELIDEFERHHSPASPIYSEQSGNANLLHALRVCF